MEKIECKKHKLVFVKNIYGEKKPKSEWKCSECGKKADEEYRPLTTKYPEGYVI